MYLQCFMGVCGRGCASLDKVKTGGSKEAVVVVAAERKADTNACPSVRVAALKRCVYVCVSRT